MRNGISRQRLLGTGVALLGAGLAAPALAQQANSTEIGREISRSTRHNISAFRTLSWQDHFSETRGGVIGATSSRALQHWGEDLSVFRLYPTSGPLTEELTRLGITEVLDKVVAPPWRPTPSMRERNPGWPGFAPGGDPMNPLGPHALYLSWQDYRIPGTHDTRRIGRRSPNGGLGLCSEHTAELFQLAQVGTQMKLI